MAQTISALRIEPDRLAYIKEKLDEALVKKDSLLLAEAWYLYGKTYSGIGDFKTSQFYFLKSLKIQERYGDSFKLGRLYIRFSENERRQGHFKESIRFGKLAEGIFRRVNSEEGLMTYYGNLGRILRKNWGDSVMEDSSRFDSLLSVHKKTELLAKQLRKPLMVAESNLFLGELTSRSNPEHAIHYINIAIRLYSNLNSTGTARSYLSIVPVYIHTKRFKLALEALEKSSKYYNENGINDIEFQLAFLTNSLLYYRTTGNLEKALKYLEGLRAVEKTQLIADRNGAITRLNLEFNAEKKEKQLLAQQREISLRKANLSTQERLSWSLAGILAISITASFVFFRLYRKNQQTSLWNGELLKEQNHRVKNNLQIISSLLNMQSKRLTGKDAKEAIDETRLRVESMAILHRRLYDGEKFAKVNLDEFIPDVVTGVLQSYGYDRLKPIFDIQPGSIGADKAIRVGLILNELSTNACKYAFPFANPPRFDLACSWSKNTVSLSVIDNGPGMQQTVAESSNTITDSSGGTLGLSLIKTQVIQLNGNSHFGPRKDFKSGMEFTLQFTIS